MPILRLESSLKLPSYTLKADALALFAGVFVRNLDVKPAQVRAAIIDMDPAATHVGGVSGIDAPPWIVGWVSILEGRDEAKRAGFIAELLTTIAAAYGVNESIVRVLVQEYPSVHWGIGRTPAAAER